MNYERKKKGAFYETLCNNDIDVVKILGLAAIVD